jgi:putative membrane protein
MYVKAGARITDLIWHERWSILALTVMAVGTELLEPYLPQTQVFSVTYVGVFSAALSIFLVFRFNEAYERWWEARKLWGSVVNLSRDFARQVLSLLPGDPGSPLRTRLVYGQIAFVHALRIRLREGASKEGRTEVESILRRLLPEECDSLLLRENVPTAILQRQSELLVGRLDQSTSDTVLLARFDANLGQLMGVFGACERIKNTPFPVTVTLISRVLVWGLALLLFIATLEPGGRGGLTTTVGVAVMAMGYIWIDGMGQRLKDPFENQPNDTPMTSLSITIERDLREMLGETELPALLKPRRGVLL